MTVIHVDFRKLETQTLSMANIVIALKQEENYRRLSQSQLRILQTAEQMSMDGEDWSDIGLMYYRILDKTLKSLQGESYYQKIMRIFK